MPRSPDLIAAPDIPTIDLRLLLHGLIWIVIAALDGGVADVGEMRVALGVMSCQSLMAV